MKVFIIIETDYEWQQIKAAFSSKEKAVEYLETSKFVDRTQYDYPIIEKELQ